MDVPKIIVANFSSQQVSESLARHVLHARGVYGGLALQVTRSSQYDEVTGIETGMRLEIEVLNHRGGAWRE